MKLSLEDERERLAAYKTTAEHFRGREGGSERIARLHHQRKLVTALEQLEQAREALIEILSCEDLHPDHIRMAYEALKQQEARNE